MTGFTLFAKGKDVFIETSYTRKTKDLARKIIRAMNATGEFNIDPDSPGGIDTVLWFMTKADCEIHETSRGRKFYEIHGDGFGGRGSFVDDGKTIVIHL